MGNVIYGKFGPDSEQHNPHDRTPEPRHVVNSVAYDSDLGEWTLKMRETTGTGWATHSLDPADVLAPSALDSLLAWLDFDAADDNEPAAA